MEIVKADGPYPKCYRCDLELNPWALRDPLTKHCPRCAYDLTIIDITSEIVDPEVLKERVALKEYCAMFQILSNWADGYENVINRDGVNWSLPHEYLQEVAEQMMPYLARLRETEYFSKEMIASLGEYFYSKVGEMIKLIEAEEDLMRLTGRWNDNEQEIKDYWDGKFQKAYGLTFQEYIQLPLRDDQRKPDDCSGLPGPHEEGD